MEENCYKSEDFPLALCKLEVQSRRVAALWKGEHSQGRTLTPTPHPDGSPFPSLPGMGVSPWMDPGLWEVPAAAQPVPRHGSSAAGSTHQQRPSIFF